MALLINVPTWTGLPAPNFSAAFEPDNPTLDTGASTSSKSKYNVTPPLAPVQSPITQLAPGEEPVPVLEDDNGQYPTDQGRPIVPVRQDIANLGETPTLVMPEKSSLGILVVVGLVGAAIYNARRKR